MGNTGVGRGPKQGLEGACAGDKGWGDEVIKDIFAVGEGWGLGSLKTDLEVE